MQYCRWRRIHKLITRKKVRLYLTFTLKTYLDTNLIYCRFTYYVTNLMDQKDKGYLRLEKVTKLDKTCVRVRVLLTLITELMIIIITITILPVPGPGDLRAGVQQRGHAALVLVRGAHLGVVVGVCPLLLNR